MVIGKSVKPRAFQNAKLPVVYKATKKGWMSTSLFLDWFKNYFIPDVKKYLAEVNRPLKALLILDNAPSHPKEEDINFDPNFRVLFLPPNCTAILQPMDQNLIQNIKVSYRKQLLEYILKENDGNIALVLKKFNLKIAVTFLDLAWQKISEKNIQKSWSPLWTQLASQWEDEDLIPLKDLRHEILSGSVFADLRSIQHIITTLNPKDDIPEKEIHDWATGVNEFLMDLTDEEIIEHAAPKEISASLVDSEEDEDIAMGVKDKIAHNDAMKAFAICGQWAEENDVSMQDIVLLKRLEEKARKSYNNKIIQPKISAFFSSN